MKIKWCIELFLILIHTVEMECSSIPVRLHNWLYYSHSVSQILTQKSEYKSLYFVFSDSNFYRHTAQSLSSPVPSNIFTLHLFVSYYFSAFSESDFLSCFSFFLNYRSRVIPISIHRLFCPKCNPNAIHRLDKIYVKWGMNRKRVSEIWLLFKKVKNGWKSKVPAWNHWGIMFISGFISFHCYL